MTTDTINITGRIDTKAYSAETLPDNWDELSDKEKLEATRDLEADEEHTDYNTTVFGMHEYFAINLDPTQTLEEDVTYLAIGDDDTAPSVGNDALNNEVFRKEVTDYSQTDNELLASTFIESDEANDETFREVGLFAGGEEPGDDEFPDRMWNHSTIASIEKDNTRTITIDVTLTFTAA